MQINPISCNESFTGRKVGVKGNTKNIVHTNMKKNPVCNGVDSVLFYFAALLGVFGINRPFDRLIDKLSRPH